MPGKIRVSHKVVCRAVAMLQSGQITGTLEDVIARWITVPQADITAAIGAATIAGLVAIGPEDRWILTGKGENLLREWMAVITKTSFGSEFAVMLGLAEQGYSTWLPLGERTVKRRGKPTRIRSALFAGFVFVRRTPLMRIAPITNTRGVTRIMCDASGVPLWIPDAQFDKVRVLIDAGGGAYQLDTEPARRVWSHGEKALIVDGPMAGWDGLVDGPHVVLPEEHVRLSLDTKSGTVTISVADAMLAREEIKTSTAAGASQPPKKSPSKRSLRRAS